MIWYLNVQILIMNGVLHYSPRKSSMASLGRQRGVNMKRVHGYSIETLRSYAQSQKVQIPENSTKSEMIQALFYDENQNVPQKSISFSMDSPRRYRMPDKFKTPPSPLRIGDENSKPLISPILIHKKSITMCKSPPRNASNNGTPYATFRTQFSSNDVNKVSPIINNLAGSVKRDSSLRSPVPKLSNNSKKKSNSKNSFRQYLPFFISFFVSGCVVTFAIVTFL